MHIDLYILSIQTYAQVHLCIIQCTCTCMHNHIYMYMYMYMWYFNTSLHVHTNNYVTWIDYQLLCKDKYLILWSRTPQNTACEIFTTNCAIRYYTMYLYSDRYILVNKMYTCLYMVVYCIRVTKTHTTTMYICQEGISDCIHKCSMLWGSSVNKSSYMYMYNVRCLYTCTCIEMNSLRILFTL